MHSKRRCLKLYQSLSFLDKSYETSHFFKLILVKFELLSFELQFAHFTLALLFAPNFTAALK
ncbi:hypothetical protein BpHYR1_046074 [Brachionus plicatilis]|uniref:Uncharacterized protein n=1 Tax=Brachionus plicatilis TaxID=10195 RepID=A0A3M7SR85_BRAPC|nr:hypothetical protein BpHYR1_046074 [Brachionus plicatilis]